MKNRKNIVILGAGFAGLRVARILSKKLRGNDEYRIKLIDKRSFHLYTPDLYEVATAFNEKITDECLLRLKETVATPIESLIDPIMVDFVFARVTGIDTKKKCVKLRKGEDLKYEYLVVALGAEVNFFGIKGMEQYSYPLKTVGQALAINCGVDQYFHQLWNKREHHEDVNITICGAGATGVETAAEMVFACNKLCEKYEYNRKKVHVQLVEGGNDLVNFPKKGTEKVHKRLKKLGVKVYLNSYITEARKKSLKLKTPDGEKTLDTDITIWTGGVKVNDVVANSLGDKERRGAILVDQTLQSKVDRAVFALGDNAFIQDDDGNIVPWLAQMAVEEADTAAKNIVALINGRELKKFKAPKRIPVVIPVGGSYAFLKWGNIVFGGYFFYILRNYIDFTYYLTLMPFGRAFSKWRRGEKIFEANN